MSVNVKIPDELYQKAAELAKQRHVSVDEIFASAFSQQIVALEQFQQRAARGDRNKFLNALRNVPDAEPNESDQP